jgi:hypothetical protein
VTNKRDKEFDVKVKYLKEVGDSQGLLDLYFAKNQKIERPKSNNTVKSKIKTKRLRARKARKRNTRKNR